jgi:flagella basal body P-ring formation protein FlgA
MKLLRLHHEGIAGGPGLFAALFLILFALHASASEALNASTIPDPPVVTQLRPAAQVDGEGVLLSQIIESRADLPRLRLCDAPACGKSVLLRRAEIAELARVAGLDQPLTNWSGPDSVRVSRRVRPLAEKEALQLLTSALQQDYVKEQGELELRFWRPWMVINIPDEPFTIKVLDVPISGMAPAVIIRFEVQTARGEPVGSWQASLQAKVWREVWVARVSRKRGDSVRSDDFVRERRDMLVCREALTEFAPGDPTLEFVEPIQSGAPLLSRLVRRRAIVHRGQSIAATIQDGAIMITLRVEALEDGAAGQIIRVRNPLSRRDLHGKVLDEENILVCL